MTHLPRPLVAGVSGAMFALTFHRHLPVTVQRKILDLTARAARLPEGTRVERLTLGGRPAERVAVGAGEHPRAVLYLHGGGYVVGSPASHRNLAAHLALHAEATVYCVDYRLAPEHPYPAALDDAEEAFRALVDKHGLSPDQIAVAGDSAGGGLAVATARRLVDAGLVPSALALLSPWTDPSNEAVERRRDMVVNLAWGRQCARLYRGGADPRDPGYAPMHGRLDGLPPTLIHHSRRELLRGQITTFAERLAEAGVPVHVIEHPNLWHSGHTLAGTVREATEAVEHLGDFLSRQFDAQPALPTSVA